MDNKIGICRNGNYIEVSPKELTTDELVAILSGIEIAYENSWVPEITKRKGYGAINEAIRRLKCAKVSNKVF